MIEINAYRLIPAPLVTVSKTANFSSDGQVISQLVRIDLDGTLLPGRGSPSSTGWHTAQGYEPADELFSTDNTKFNSLLAKQELLKELFATTGFRLRYSATGVSPIECFPIIDSFSLDQGNWVTLSKYKIGMHASQINRSGSLDPEDHLIQHATGLNLTAVSDSWSIRERPDDRNILEVVRDVNATANMALGSAGMIGTEPWRNAKTWVEYRLANYGLTSGLFHMTLPTNTGLRFNVVEEEDVNRFAGSYSLRQRYVYHHANYIDRRSVSTVTDINRVADGGPLEVQTITVNGTIEGLDANNIPANKLTNANTYWESIRDGIGATVGAFGSGVNYNVAKDSGNGTLSYSIQFINNSGSTYRHIYDVSFEIQNSAFPTVTIAGQIIGASNDDLAGIGNVRYNRALSGWTAVEPTLKSLSFANTTNGQLFGYGTTYGNLFSSEPISKRVSSNPPQGTIQYNYTFGYLDGGSASANYLDQYNVDISTANAPDARSAGYLVNASINGTVIGLASGDDPSDRMTKATEGWALVQHSIFSRVSGELSKIGSGVLPLLHIPLSKAIGVNRAAGSITYQFAYGNARMPYNSGVAVLDVKIDDSHPIDLTAIQVIPGRASGPIIQNIATSTERRRAINIAMTLFPKTNGTFWDFMDKAFPITIASGLLASGTVDLGTRGSSWFIAGDTDNWDWKNGFYTRNIQIIY